MIDLQALVDNYLRELECETPEEKITRFERAREDSGNESLIDEVTNEISEETKEAQLHEFVINSMRRNLERGNIVSDIDAMVWLMSEVEKMEEKDDCN